MEPLDEQLVVAGDQPLLRRALHREDHLVWHPDFKRFVPTLAALQFDHDGMSVFLRGALEDRGHGPADVSTLGGTNMKPAVVYQFLTQVAQHLGFAALSSSNDETVIGYAHVSVIDRTRRSNADLRAARSDLASVMSKVYGEITLPLPQGA